MIEKSTPAMSDLGIELGSQALLPSSHLSGPGIMYFFLAAPEI